MAYIKVRKKSDISTRYTAILRKRVGKTMSIEAKTELTKAQARRYQGRRSVSGNGLIQTLE